jgi:hypothetical protein
MILVNGTTGIGPGVNYKPLFEASNEDEALEMAASIDAESQGVCKAHCWVRDESSGQFEFSHRLSGVISEFWRKQ